jgi:putative transcriptional regulator
MLRIKLKQVLDDAEFAEGCRITFKELARRSGISPATLTRLANLPGYNATLDYIDALCGALHCQPGDLLEYVAVPKKIESERAKQRAARRKSAPRPTGTKGHPKLTRADTLSQTLFGEAAK